MKKAEILEYSEIKKKAFGSAFYVNKILDGNPLEHILKNMAELENDGEENAASREATKLIMMEISFRSMAVVFEKLIAGKPIDVNPYRELRMAIQQVEELNGRKIR